jgi:hypothetical protein
MGIKSTTGNREERERFALLVVVLENTWFGGEVVEAKQDMVAFFRCRPCGY